jgi:hypothetical protein
MNLDLPEYLEGLSRPARRSRGEKTVIAQDIEKNRDDIESYIGQLERDGKRKLARRYRKGVKKYETRPKGMYYNEQIGAVRSFVPSRGVRSFTFHTDKRWSKIVGYAAFALVIGFTLYAAYIAGREVWEFGEEYGEKFQREEVLLEERLKK